MERVRLLCEHSFVYSPHALCGDQLSGHPFLTCALQVHRRSVGGDFELVPYSDTFYLTYVLIRAIICADKERRGEMKYSELEKELRKAKCRVLKEGANHTIWYSPITGQTFPVSRHKTEEVPIGTLKSIKRAAGI